MPRATAEETEAEGRRPAQSLAQLRLGPHHVAGEGGIHEGHSEEVAFEPKLED